MNSSCDENQVKSKPDVAFFRAIEEMELVAV